jgi:hypothetical protein
MAHARGETMKLRWLLAVFALGFIVGEWSVRP